MYYIGDVLGITQDFKIKPDEEISHAIFKADKKSYGKFIFKKTIGGFKEIITGKTFKAIGSGYANDGYPYYWAPSSTGLVVSESEIRAISRAISKAKVAEYKEKLNKEDLMDFFETAQKETNKYLNMGKLRGQSIEEIELGPKQSSK